MLLFCLGIISLTELSRKEVLIDCRTVTTYPYAIDTPKALIEKCRGERK